MADKYTDPFDTAGPPKAAKAAGPEKYTDPFDAAQQHYGGGAKQGGTFETPSGQMPGVPTLSDTDRPLGVMDRMQSGTIEDPQAKLQFFASRRFPQLPPQEAVKRYGYVGGEPVYLDDSGGLRRENEGDAFIPGNVAAWVGENALPIVGSTVGGILGAGPGGAALGGAGGKAFTKLIGQASGDKQSALGNTVDLAAEGLLNAAGWKAGDMFGKAVFEGRVARDAGKFQKPDALALVQKGKEFGIDLTPAEASNLGSLISQQQRMGVGFDEAGDIIRQFLQKRTEQVDDAVSGFIGKPPPAATVGGYARDVGKQAVDDVTAARAAASRSTYRTVARPDVLVPEHNIDELMADDYIRSAFDTANTNPRYGVIDHPNNSMSKIDAVKQIMDDEIEVAAGRGQTKMAAVMNDRRRRLVAFADRQFESTRRVSAPSDVGPGFRDLRTSAYRNARQSFENASPAVDDMAASLEGTLSRIQDAGLKNAADSIFKGQNVGPREVASVRRQFVTQGKEKEWNDVLSHWLRSNWEGPATKDVQAGTNFSAGANFRKAVFGTKNQKQIMREAMGPDRYATFEKLMDVLEATGRVQRGQSMTEPAQQAARAEMREAAPIVDKMRGVGGLGGLRDWWIDTKVGDWRATLAKAITSPDGVLELEKLRKLKGLDPGSKNAISIVTNALTKAGVYAPASVLGIGQPADELPPQLTQRARQ